MTIESVTSYKDLLELIDINENILNGCREDLKLLMKYPIESGAPSGYPTGTSYVDADCIHGGRKEIHIETWNKLIEEIRHIENIIFLQEERLSRLYKIKNGTEEKLKNIDGIELKVAVKRIIDKKTQESTAKELNYSVRQIQRIESKIRGEKE